MARLLIITYHFPPDGAIGGQRWAGLSKYLARLGWEVHVVTAAPAGDGDSPSSVHRHVRARRRTVNDVYRDRASRVRPVQGSNAPGPDQSSGRRSFGSLILWPLRVVKRFVGSAIWFPDYGRGWIVRAGLTARALLREREFDAVISSGPPHSAHLAGVLATVGRRTPLWLDMRDPWASTHKRDRPDEMMFRIERFWYRRLEQLVFRRAARVLVNTEEFAQALRRQQPGLDVVCFSNGVDLESLPMRDPSRVESGSIAHVGALYAGRNLSSLFAAARALLRERPDAADFKVDLAGPMEDRHREQMLADLSVDGLGAHVRIHGVVPRAQALTLLSRSRLALVLAQDQPMQIPAKLYECVGLGVPTLVIAEATSAAAREARRIGAMTLESNDVAGMTAVLADLVSGRIPLTVDPITPISYAELAVRMGALIRPAADSASPARLDRAPVGATST